MKILNKISKTEINTLKLINKYPNRYSTELAILKAQNKKESKQKGVKKYQANISRSINKLQKKNLVITKTEGKNKRVQLNDKGKLFLQDIELQQEVNQNLTTQDVVKLTNQISKLQQDIIKLQQEKETLSALRNSDIEGSNVTIKAKIVNHEEGSNIVLTDKDDIYLYNVLFAFDKKISKVTTIEEIDPLEPSQTSFQVTFTDSSTMTYVLGENYISPESNIIVDLGKSIIQPIEDSKELTFTLFNEKYNVSQLRVLGKRIGIKVSKSKNEVLSWYNKLENVSILDLIPSEQ